MRYFLLLFLLNALFTNTLLAQNAHALVSYALKKHPSLHSIQQRLDAMDYTIKKSQNWKNPDVSLSISDIHFDDVFNRSLEPMQYQALNVKQKFPWFGKLKAKQHFEEAKKDVILDSYKMAKVTLAKQIYVAIYTLKEWQGRMNVLKQYQILVNENIVLYNAYASIEDKSHSNAMSAKLLLSKLRIREENYLAQLKTQKAKLSYLLQKKVQNVSISMQIQKPKSLAYYLRRLKNNPQYQQKTTKEHLASKYKDIQDLSIHPDPYVKLGYFNRDGYDDFASISVGISLPLYGTEKLNSQEAKVAMLATQSQTLDFKSSLKSQIETAHIKLNEAYNVYHILHDKSLPQLQHMLELSQSDIQKGADLFSYISLLEQQLFLEEESLRFQANYLRTQAQLNGLIGLVFVN